MVTQRSTLGTLAEDMAAQYLTAHGYKVLEQNYRKPWGELDIVAQKGSSIIFTEVKASRQENAGFEPELRAGYEKMKKVVRTAKTWLSSHKYPEGQEWQIDIISVTFNKEKKTAKIRHYKNVDLSY